MQESPRRSPISVIPQTSAIPTSTRHSPKPPVIPAKPPSFPRTREPRIHKARLFRTAARDHHKTPVGPHFGHPPNVRHSRETPSFPRTREPRIHKARLFRTTARDHHKILVSAPFPPFPQTGRLGDGTFIPFTQHLHPPPTPFPNQGTQRRGGSRTAQPTKPSTPKSPQHTRTTTTQS